MHGQVASNPYRALLTEWPQNSMYAEGPQTSTYEGFRSEGLRVGLDARNLRRQYVWWFYRSRCFGEHWEYLKNQPKKKGACPSAVFGTGILRKNCHVKLAVIMPRFQVYRSMQGFVQQQPKAMRITLEKAGLESEKVTIYPSFRANKVEGFLMRPWSVRCNRLP